MGVNDIDLSHCKQFSHSVSELLARSHASLLFLGQFACKMWQLKQILIRWYVVICNERDYLRIERITPIYQFNRKPSISG